MRIIKMLGLTTIAAVAAMAFVGASSTMAQFQTVLCETDNGTLKCSTNEELTIHLVAKTPELLSSLPTVLCEKSLFKGMALKLAQPLQIHIKELTYTKCHVVFGFLITCVVTVPHFGLLLLLKTGSNRGTLTDSENGGKFTEVNVNCSGVINCTFKGEGLSGAATGAPTGTFAYAGAKVAIVPGGECPKEAFLDATFVDTGIHYIKE